MIKLTKTTPALTFLLGILTILWTGCSKEAVTTVDASAANLDSFFVDEQPENAVSVLQARSTAKAGDIVRISGQIGGSTLPFTEGYAAFVIADKSLVFCSENPEDSCSTPWDACCEPQEKINSARALIQFTDGEGNPVAAGLKGYNGLTELDHVVVTGVVNEQSTPENLIIDGQTLYIAASE
jgi:hypothetical protein